MSKYHTFLLGALGGFLPTLLSLATGDIAALLDHRSDITFGNYTGYGLKVLALLVLGGIIAALNNEVKQPISLVQLGVAAPALVTAYINGTVPPRVGSIEFPFVSSLLASPISAEKPIELADSFFLT